MQQLLTESLAIALLGGTLGMFVGWGLTAELPVFAPADFPRLNDIHVDAGFLMVSASLAIFVGMVSGMVPALRGSRVDLAVSMQAGGPWSVGASGGRIRGGLPPPAGSPPRPVPRRGRPPARPLPQTLLLAAR